MDNSPTEPDLPPISLLDCSLEDLVIALLHRQPVAAPGQETPFILNDDNARRIFSYYARTRGLWPRAKPVRSSEVDDVLNALDATLPPIKATGTRRSAATKLWKLCRIEAHRFGGLHRHCGTDGQDPDIFILDIERDVTLIAGFNGAGKTALQNAIIWCVTGRALRSQHLPSEVHEPMDVFWTHQDDEEQAAYETALALPPIVPIPSATELEGLNDRPRIDTWAQLTFREMRTDEICVVRRSLTVNSRGKIGMSVSGLGELQLPDLALEVGTLMPGIASHMRFDEKTTFAAAIAQLTGLKPLEDLGHRSKRLAKRLRTDEQQKTESEATTKLTEFRTKKRSLLDAWASQKDLDEPGNLIGPDEETEADQCKALISTTRRHLELTKETLESRAETVLGQPLQLASPDDADSLLRRLSHAADLLTSTALKALPSLSTAAHLAAIADNDVSVAITLIESMVSRAVPVAARQRNRQQAARKQLYSRIAAWHRQQHGDTEIEKCPVCGTDLATVPTDALLSESVKEALRSANKADEDTAKDAKEWERDAAREFLDRLPESLRRFADTPPPSDVMYIYRQAYTTELLSDRNFDGPLRSLKKNAMAVWESAATAHPLIDLPESTTTIWPDPFKSGSLSSRSENIANAIRLATHRTVNKVPIKAIVERYIGSTKSPGSLEASYEPSDVPACDLPLREQINALRLCVTNTTPILSLIRQLDELDVIRKAYASLTRRLGSIELAATAVELFADFPTLVFQQVSGLISELDHGTRHWLDRIYRPHYVGGPAYSGFDATDEKGLGLRAGIGDMQVPAHKIMNASQLRACVWAFLFSLWERVRTNLGTIDCMLLDDPQIHFDPINAENLAAAIPVMPTRGIRPLVTSHDYRFLSAIRDKLPSQSLAVPSWSAQVINPISSSRLTAGLSPSVDEVHERQKAWKADENDESKARQFVSSVRIYIENRLWDLLASDPAIKRKPTLSVLVRSLRTAKKNGEPPFEEPPFAMMLSHVALNETAPFYQCINKAHHRPQDITPYDAVHISDTFTEVDRLLRSCSASYARFMGRLTREDATLLLFDLPKPPPAAIVERPPLTVLGQVAARSAADILASGEPSEILDMESLGEVALYGVRSPGLSPLALQGQIVVVSLEKHAQDGEPVVALCGGKIYLRRVSMDQRDPSRVVLTCDRTGTERVPPTLLLPRARTRLLPLVGVLYEQERFEGAEEATEVPNSRLLQRNLVAARVTDDSAHPIIRNGDFVLMEAVDNLDENQIAQLEDTLVVAVLGSGSDRFAFLKRLGALAAPGVRILENIGLKGNALSVALSDEAMSSNVPPLQMLWRVHGTLRN